MRYYLAPMEGITGWVYRQVQHECFPAFDKYFTPFLVPRQKKVFHAKEIRDILPENNEGMTLVPQLLTNRAEDFIRGARLLAGYGYHEVNLNLGCPSGTVVSRGRGAGFLASPQLLKAFLDEVFSAFPDPAGKPDGMAVSIKTRLGMEDAEEFVPLIELYRQYPLKELIVHPRVREDYYGNRPDWEAFAGALPNTPFPVIYNGDLFAVSDLTRFRERFADVGTVMLGRGAVADPSLLRQMKGGTPYTRKELQHFLDRLAEAYGQVLSGERDVLFKLKELWFYLGQRFPEGKAELKRIRKSQHLSEYQAAVRSLLLTMEGGGLC